MSEDRREARRSRLDPRFIPERGWHSICESQGAGPHLCWLVHRPDGDRTPKERAIVYLAVSFGVMLLGPGRYSQDTMFFGRRDWVAEEKKEWLKIPAA